MTKCVGGLSQEHQDLNLRNWGGSENFILSTHRATLPGQARIFKSNEKEFSAISVIYCKVRKQ